MKSELNSLSKLEQQHARIRGNRWHWLFYVFCRFALALGFIPAGLVKIMNERFAGGLSVLHPMGHYLEALHHTGFYYTFIGVVQVIAAVLLLIPRTVTLGAILYLPIILNICILSVALRFDGSFVTAPLMVLANLYVLAWNFDRIKFIFPFSRNSEQVLLKRPGKYSKKFPFAFFGGVAGIIGIVMLFALYGYDIKPKNSMKDCERQFIGSQYEVAGLSFCKCIHKEGRFLDECLEEYKKGKR